MVESIDWLPRAYLHSGTKKCIEIEIGPIYRLPDTGDGERDLK